MGRGLSHTFVPSPDGRGLQGLSNLVIENGPRVNDGDLRQSLLRG